MLSTTKPSATTDRPCPRGASRWALAGLAMALLVTAGCGGYSEGYVYEDPYVAYGAVEVDNRTDSTTFEDVYGFYMAPAGTGAFTGNLLSGPLPPGFVEDVGDFVEDFYDAEADVGDFGDVSTWFDVLVPAGDVTTFEVF
jgi:hypothetical protein